jgi:hypothetical protein
MANKWIRGHVSRFWDQDEYKKFNYIKQPLMDSEIQEWKNKGYDYVKSFSGSMYDNRNPLPEWVKRFDNIFNLKNMTYNFYKMSQLEIMPEHVDHFQTYMRLFDAKYENVTRILVMLEDWKPGHYLEIDGVGVVNWVAGDYFMWESNVPHAAANIGIEDRYTLQITGTVFNSETVYRHIHWYNIPKLETKKESLFSPEMHYMKQQMNKTTPYFIYMYNREIKELEEMKHDTETVEFLNKEGVDIYLFEPICSYKKGDKQLYPPNGTIHSLTFYSEFHFDHVQNPYRLRAVELDSIEKYIDNNNLTNVTVRTCDYNIEQFYAHYSSKMHLVTDDLFIKYFDLREFQDLIDSGTNEEEYMGNFTRRFVSLNWRYAPHRQLVTAYLANYAETCSLTWLFKADMGTVSVEPWYSVHDWSKKNPEVFNKMITGFNRLNAGSPWYIDLDVREATLVGHSYFKTFFPGGVIFDHKVKKQGDNEDRLKMVYYDVFCDVVTESRFAQPTSNYSEKVYRPMFYKKPFIMVGPPHTLDYMREQGFKTFDEFWDESYNKMEDHESRLFAIFKLIEQINKMSIGELKEMYDRMLPIVEHNRKVLLEKCPLRPKS